MPERIVKTDTEFVSFPQPRLLAGVEDFSFTPESVDIEKIFYLSADRLAEDFETELTNLNQAVTSSMITALREMKSIVLNYYGKEEEHTPEDWQYLQLSVNKDFSNLCRKVELALGRGFQFLKAVQAGISLISDKTITEQKDKISLGQVLDFAGLSIFHMDPKDTDFGRNGYVREILLSAKEFVRDMELEEENATAYWDRISEIDMCCSKLAKLISRRTDEIVPQGVQVFVKSKNLLFEDVITYKVEARSRLEKAVIDLYPETPRHFGRELGRAELYLYKKVKDPSLLKSSEIDFDTEPLAEIIFEKGNYYEMRACRLVLSLLNNPAARSKEKISKVFNVIKEGASAEFEGAEKLFQTVFPELLNDLNIYFTHVTTKLDSFQDLAEKLVTQNK